MKAAQDMKEGAEHGSEELKHKGEQVLERGQEKAHEAARQTRGKLRETLEERSQQVAEQVGSTAGAMRKVSEELRDKGKDQPATLFSQGAEQAERLGRYLRESDVDRMLEDVEGLVRRKPWVTVAGGALGGLALSRLLKASSNRRQSSGGRQQGGQHADRDRQEREGPEAASALTVPAAPAGALVPTPAAPPLPTTRRL